MHEHTGISKKSGDFWGCWKEQFPISVPFLSGTAGSMESCRLDPGHRDSELCLLEGCPFHDIFYFSHTLFYELQRHALPL